MSCSLTDNSALDVYRMFVVVVGQRRLVCRASGRVLAISHVGPISHFSRFGYCKVTWTSWHYSFKRFKRLLKTFLFGCWDRSALWLTLKPRLISFLTYLLTVFQFYMKMCNGL